MGDLEIRAFGLRLLIVAERPKPAEPVEPHEQTTHHGGQFEPHSSDWYDDREVGMGFRPTRRSE